MKVEFSVSKSTLVQWTIMASESGMTLGDWIIATVNENPKISSLRVKASGGSRPSPRNARRGAPGKISAA